MIDAGHVNPAIRAVRGHLDRVLIEAHFDQQVADERLEAFGGMVCKELHQLGARALVNLLHMRVDPLGLPLRQTEATMPGAHEVGAFLLGVGVKARAHCGFRGLALGRDQFLGQRALRDLLEVQRLASSFEDSVGGVKIGHDCTFPEQLTK